MTIRFFVRDIQSHLIMETKIFILIDLNEKEQYLSSIITSYGTVTIDILHDQ